MAAVAPPALSGFVISFSATNPCHLYDLAQGVFRFGHLGRYYSGYPRWRLNCPAEFPLVALSYQTVLTYAALRLPSRCRPAPASLFRWQDKVFDSRIAQILEPTRFLHAMPGQCLKTFTRARQLDVRTVLNHASGPTARQRDVENEERRRLGLRVPRASPAVQQRLEVEQHEYALADYHCVASALVKTHLIEQGIAADRIAVIRYGANPDIFRPGLPPNDPLFHIVFAGQANIRKGFHHLLDALRQWNGRSAVLHVFGEVSSELSSVLPVIELKVYWHHVGFVSQSKLAAAFQKASVLVLPSLEEGFGLVVAQALACGLPCIVSDQVGAADLIQHRVNGSIVPVGDRKALLDELHYWAENRRRVLGRVSWNESAQGLIDWTLRLPYDPPAKGAL